MPVFHKGHVNQTPRPRRTPPETAACRAHRRNRPGDRKHQATTRPATTCAEQYILNEPVERAFAPSATSNRSAPSAAGAKKKTQPARAEQGWTRASGCITIGEP